MAKHPNNGPSMSKPTFRSKPGFKLNPARKAAGEALDTTEAARARRANEIAAEGPDALLEHIGLKKPKRH